MANNFFQGVNFILLAINDLFQLSKLFWIHLSSLANCQNQEGSSKIVLVEDTIQAEYIIVVAKLSFRSKSPRLL